MFIVLSSFFLREGGVHVLLQKEENEQKKKKYLASMSQSSDASCCVHTRPHILDLARHRIPDQTRSAHMHAHPHPQPFEDHPVICVAPLLRCARMLQQCIWPFRLHQLLLHLLAPFQCMDRLLEGHTEGAFSTVPVPDEEHLIALVLLEKGTQERVVKEGGIFHGQWVEFPE